MPLHGDKQKCTFKGCDGIMTFNDRARQPGSGVGVAGPDDKITFPRDFRVRAWVCDKNTEHFEPEN